MSKDVHVGEDGWLFLTGGRNSPDRMYQRSVGHAWLMRRWAWLIAKRARRCRALGISYVHLTVPEKLSVYANKAPALGIDPRLGYGQRLCRIVNDPQLCLDVAGPLLARREQFETFMKTDSHWSSDGCKVAHDVICQAVGAPLRWRLDDRPFAARPDFVGDLGVKMSPPHSEPISRYHVQRDAVRFEANELVQRYEGPGGEIQLHRDTRIALRNEAPDADPRRLLLFGDSYSDLSMHALTAMLAETFREVHFIWSIAVDWAYVERIRPDLIVTQIAERFMVLLPDDDRYDNEASVGARLREMDAPPA